MKWGGYYFATGLYGVAGVFALFDGTWLEVALVIAGAGTLLVAFYNEDCSRGYLKRVVELERRNEQLMAALREAGERAARGS